MEGLLLVVGASGRSGNGRSASSDPSRVGTGSLRDRSAPADPTPAATSRTTGTRPSTAEGHRRAQDRTVTLRHERPRPAHHDTRRPPVQTSSPRLWSRLRDVRRVPSTQWGVEGAVDILRPVSRTSSTVPCGRQCCGEVGLLASRRRRGTAVRTGSGCSRGCSSPPPPNGPRSRSRRPQSPRGWRSLITVPAAGADVEVVVGGVEYAFRSDRGGYVHGEIRATLAPGWHEVTVAVAGRAPVAARVRVVDDRTARGVVSDIDDTILVTWLPRPLPRRVEHVLPARTRPPPGPRHERVAPAARR